MVWDRNLVFNMWTFEIWEDERKEEEKERARILMDLLVKERNSKEIK